MANLTHNIATGTEGATSGALWGLPRDVSTFALYLNLDLLAEAGFTGDKDPRELAKAGKWDWAAFLQVRVLFGVIWAGVCAAVEAFLAGGQQPAIWPSNGSTWAAMVFIAVGPSILAYRCWGLGVQAVGPTMASFFGNLTDIFAALWSALFLGQHPRWYHPVALLLIPAGILGASAGPPDSQSGVDRDKG